MEYPLVSIIVPMYNAAHFISRCVESICAQTYKSIEILLLDDGSTDDTAALCARLAEKDPRIALVRKANSGASDTRNQGIALAHGKYVQFVDSDDWLAPAFTEKLVAAAEQNEADLVIAPFWMVYPDDYADHPRLWEKALSPLLRRNPPKTQAYGFLPAGIYDQRAYARHLLDYPNTFFYGVLWNKLYRRDILLAHQIRFRPEIFAEDQLFNTEYLRWIRKAVSISEIGYFYLQNTQSVSHAKVTTADILSLRQRIFRLYREIYTGLGLYRPLRRKIYAAAFGENEYTLPPMQMK